MIMYCISTLYSPSLLTTYRPKNPVAPNTVAANPLEEERPPFPLGMRAWCSSLCWTVVTDATDNPARVQPPTNRRKTQPINDQQEKKHFKSLKTFFIEVSLHNGKNDPKPSKR